MNALGFLRRAARSPAAAGLSAGLLACGGGGGAGAGPGDGPPTSGAYTWILKAQGPTEALRYGLSLVHPSRPGVEYVIEFGSAVLTDARLVSQGSIDAAGRQTGTLGSYALVYIVGGDVRRVSLLADGHAPATEVVRAQTTTVCQFITDAQGVRVGDAIDYGRPENSRFLVSTAGADGQCGTADDGRAEVRLVAAPSSGASPAITVTPLSGTPPLGMIRDAATMSPRGWIDGRNLVTWNTGAGTAVALRGDTAPAFTSLVAASAREALMDDGTQLSVVTFASGVDPVSTPLDIAATGGGGWVGIGFDADNFYTYRNQGSGFGATWSLLRIDRATPFATLLASGAGQIQVASMGRTVLYATVLDIGGNRLLAVSKSVGVPVTTLESTGSTTLSTVQTSNAGVHELWRIVNIGTAAVSYALEFIDEAGNKRYTTSAGGFPLGAVDPARIDFDSSENRARFVFANGYGARAFGDATLAGFDAAAGVERDFGTLPGSADYGVDFVYASVIGGPAPVMGGFAARSVSGNIESSGSKVFTFDFDTASSLAFATKTQ